jgi:hypothetical protein
LTEKSIRKILSLEPRTTANFSAFGGGKRDRTADLLHAMQALSQLSYTPDFCTRFFKKVSKSAVQARPRL